MERNGSREVVQSAADYGRNHSDYISSNRTVKNPFSLQKSTAEVHRTDWCFMHGSTNVLQVRKLKKGGVSLFYYSPGYAENLKFECCHFKLDHK